MATIGTLFTGFGGVDVGAMAAGLTPLWGVEYRADVAEVANRNLGGHVRIADVLTCDPADFAPVDVMHASPPCPNFSVAKADRGETANDLALAAKVAEFVTVLRPRVFTLENVMAYRESQSWRNILFALEDAGYWVNVEAINAADFGVPQTRKRMIVRAVLGGFVPYMPEPVPWVGWYAAIADLVPTLPDSKLAPWQLARLPQKLRETMLIEMQDGQRPEATLRSTSEPSFTLSVSMASRPSHMRAVLVPGLLNDESTTLTTRNGDAPCVTVTTSHNQRDMRAVLVAKTADKFGDGHGQESEPAQTIGANEHGSKVIAGSRVIAMTPRCLARFQSFPDWYELPGKRTLAAYGIGNAVPPLVMQRIYEGLRG